MPSSDRIQIIDKSKYRGTDILPPKWEEWRSPCPKRFILPGR